jgi:cellulose synthase/poly-beta-1,6-N-acetylglucosamine synthase-like glycosyltransferase
MILFWCSVTISLITVGLTVYLLIGFSSIKQLKLLPLITNQPPVAIIIPVRNEEADLEKALTSVCNLNYNNYRVLVVNDRSTDGTGGILTALAGQYAKLSVITIAELPAGWLGKNNALYQAYQHSTEEWMLFADADIVFHPDSLNKAVGYALNNQLDHLTILPDMKSPSVLLNGVVSTFSIMLMMHMKPWDAKKPKSKSSAGIGAFNLVRRQAYEKAGTHNRIKLRPDDDLQFGALIKSMGLRQDVLAGKEYICLEWYKNLKEFKTGLQKNTFSTADYNTSKAIANLFLILTSIALPMPVMFIFGNADVRLMVCGVLLTHIIYMALIPQSKWWHALLIPFAGFCIAWVYLQATLITLKQGGIYWRDTFYPLTELRAKS